jgi:hypothetical protein
MHSEVVEVGMEKMIMFFGVTISFLLAIITYFLKRHIDSIDKYMQELRTTTNDHENRLTILETKSEILK